MNGKVYELAAVLRELGLRTKVSKRLAKRCYQRIKTIETIARQEGRGARLGAANENYLEFFRFMEPLLSESQVNDITKRYEAVRKLWVDQNE